MTEQDQKAAYDDVRNPLPCIGWPDQPCLWDKCLTEQVCQNPGGPSGTDYAVDASGRVFVEVDGARVLSVEVVDGA